MPSSSDPAPQPTPAPGDDGKQIRIYRIERAIALLVAIIVVVVVLAVLLIGCGDDRDTADTAEGGDATKVQAALKLNARLLVGLGSADALADARCVTTGVASEFNCVPAGAPERQALRIVLRSDGTVAERLRGVDPGTVDTADGLAKALAADATARGLDAPAEYACATTVRTEPDGTMQQGTTTGFLCVAKAPADGSDSASQRARYVEPSPDGTISRDYLVDTP